MSYKIIDINMGSNNIEVCLQVKQNSGEIATFTGMFPFNTSREIVEQWASNTANSVENATALTTSLITDFGITKKPKEELKEVAEVAAVEVVEAVTAAVEAPKVEEVKAEQPATVVAPATPAPEVTPEVAPAPETPSAPVETPIEPAA